MGMAMNIVVGIMAISIFGVAFVGWWFENKGDMKKSENNKKE